MWYLSFKPRYSGLHKMRKKRIRKPTPDPAISVTNNTMNSLSANDFRSAEKVVKAIEDRLYEYGINAEVVRNEIKFLEERISLTTNETNQAANLNHIDTVPINEIDISEEHKEREIMAENVSLPINVQTTGHTTVDGGSSVSANDVNNLDIIILDFNESDKLISNDVLSGVCCVDQEPETIDFLHEAYPVDALEPETSKNENPAEAILDVMGSGSSSEVSNVPSSNAAKDVDIIHNTSEKLDNVIEQQLSPLTPFSKYLTYPVVPDGRKGNLERKEKLPSAISFKEWRKYYQSKDNIKQKKIEDIRKRKELRELRKVENAGKCIKKQMTKRKKTNSLGVKTNDNEDKTRVQCSFCEEDLVSETEEDTENNIGCDDCPRWYNLRCTEFSEYRLLQIRTTYVIFVNEAVYIT